MSGGQLSGGQLLGGQLSDFSTASIPSSGCIDNTNSNDRDILKLYSSRSLTSSGADSLTDGDIIFCRDS